MSSSGSGVGEGEGESVAEGGGGATRSTERGAMTLARTGVEMASLLAPLVIEVSAALVVASLAAPAFAKALASSARASAALHRDSRRALHLFADGELRGQGLSKCNTHLNGRDSRASAQVVLARLETAEVRAQVEES